MWKIVKLIFILFSLNSYGQSITVSGIITEKNTKENLSNVNIQNVLNEKNGSTSNAYGFYSLTIKSSITNQIRFSHVGYKSTLIQIEAVRDTVVDIVLESISKQLDEVVIAELPASPGSLSYHEIQRDVIEQAPSILGEKDIFKIVQLLPGVQRGVEGSNAFYVRGGGADQNLIIVDDATVYNANHLFGFVSAFNSDAIKNINFYKGSFPARYGGRIASVTDIQLKEGNKEKIKVQGGIGILAGRLTINGPLTNNNSSFLVSARRSFIDLLTRPFMSIDDQVGYRFYDVNVKSNLVYNAKNRFFISGYLGGDKLKTKEKVNQKQSTILSETDLGWKNRNASLRWNHIFSDKIFINTSFIYCHYDFFLTDTYKRTGLNANYSYSEFTSKINDYSIKSDLDYFLSNDHTLKFGLAATLHDFIPRGFYSKDDALLKERGIEQKYKTWEDAVYLEDHWQISDKMMADIGFRVAHLKTKEKNYYVLEPRGHLFYSVTKDLKLNAGYARTNQFLHLLSNTGVGLPTDLWVPATVNAPPQQGDQFSAGISKSFNKSRYLISVETYRRYMRNIIAYKQGAVFLNTNELSEEIQWENNIAIGKGESYGTEFMFQKKTGRITGWAAYTLSWVIHQFEDINYGKRFFPKYDSRHNIVLFCNFRITEKINISANWMYSTGSAMTVPQAYYYANVATGSEIRTTVLPNNVTNALITEQINRVAYTGSVNSFRGEAYHRLDISVQFHKKKKKLERYWEFGLFNAYNRKNPYYYYLEASNDFVNQGQRIDLKKKSLFPILPSISYNFKF